MKKISIIGIILICFVFSCTAQSVYSKQNLEQASQEDLNLYLRKAKNMRTTGIILSTVGPVTYGILLIKANSKNSNMDLGTVGVLGLLATISTVVGIPVLITGSSRVNRINKILSNNKVSIEMTPYFFQNNLAQIHQTGATLRIKF